MDPNAQNPVNPGMPAADPNAPVQAPVAPVADQPVGAPMTTPTPVEPTMPEPETPVEPAMPTPTMPEPAAPVATPEPMAGNETGGQMPPTVPPAV